MGVLRLPKPIATYIPSGPDSPSRIITTDMISPPLTPDVDSSFDTLPTAVLPALEYISNKLRGITHLTMVVGCGAPLPLENQSELALLPVGKLDAHTWRSVHRIVQKATKKFSLGSAWTTAIQQSQLQQNETHNDHLLRQSILQNDVLFSQEGLTLLNIDRVYTIKHRLRALSQGAPAKTGIPEHLYTKSCVQLLRKTITHYKGRPFSLAFFNCIYEDVHVSQDLLVRVANEYHAKYGKVGIVLPQKQHKPVFSHPQRPRHQPAHHVQKRKDGIKRLGPRTPLSASDVTPVTQGEWTMLLNSQELERGDKVTIYIPCPVKPVGA
ncbi:hypothetical protein FQN55_002060 [Onygenales sp. PD_40]|nr:hypothetical protein FQN55_002060 [Onygenales sp. PD_40]KAK2774010.1 hypothetical protein FQN53_003874 [Emmonsiellopsis sp. PD_33]